MGMKNDGVVFIPLGVRSVHNDTRTSSPPLEAGLGVGEALYRHSFVKSQ